MTVTIDPESHNFQDLDAPSKTFGLQSNLDPWTQDTASRALTSWPTCNDGRYGLTCAIDAISDATFSFHFSWTVKLLTSSLRHRSIKEAKTGSSFESIECIYFLYRLLSCLSFSYKVSNKRSRSFCTLSSLSTLQFLFSLFFSGRLLHLSFIGHDNGSKQNHAFAAHFWWLSQHPAGTWGLD